MKVAICNIAKILTGDIDSPVGAGNTIMMAGGKIISVGTSAEISGCDAIDAGGMMAVPGLIDSHVHITFGDYTLRQKGVGFLESCTHGEVTTCISASEVHVPGRPPDQAGVKALAVAASKSFENYRPGDDALPALKNRDIMGVVAGGVPRFVGQSRNTPETIHRAKVAHCKIPQSFASDH